MKSINELIWDYEALTTPPDDDNSPDANTAVINACCGGGGGGYSCWSCQRGALPKKK